MKSAVILFHKNINKYNPEWIKKCLNSIKNQTYKQFDVYELDYGGEHNQIYKGSDFASNKSIHNHAEAHNWLLDKVFTFGYDCAFNINIDDIYSLDRFEVQLKWIEQGYDLISSNFHHINERGIVIRNMRMDDKDFLYEARRGNNIIAHPVCCYSKNFWTNCSKLHPNQIPKDDFELWKRSYRQFKFKIVPEYLLYYRVHSQKVSAKGVWK